MGNTIKVIWVNTMASTISRTNPMSTSARRTGASRYLIYHRHGSTSVLKVSLFPATFLTLSFVRRPLALLLPSILSRCLSVPLISIETARPPFSRRLLTLIQLRRFGLRAFLKRNAELKILIPTRKSLSANIRLLRERRSSCHPHDVCSYHQERRKAPSPLGKITDCCPWKS
jgi:hypothetical protein